MPRLPRVRILVTNTRVGRNTQQLVAAVGELKKAHPEIVKGILECLLAC